MSSAPAPASNDRPGGHAGLAEALGAYAIWGLIPLYFHLLKAVPAFELVSWRALSSLPLCLLVLHLRGQFGEFVAALRNRRVLLALCGSALVVGANWTGYVWAVANGKVLAASLGYYINPLVNIALGMIVLGERLRPRQWLAVGIAALGIGVLAAGALDTLAISLFLALTFGGYGLIRKLVPVGSVPGLTVETLVLLPLSLGLVGWYALGPKGSALAQGPETAALLVGSGVVTAAPLVLFAIAARKLPLSTLGFAQFLSPTLQFLCGLFAFHEALQPVRLVSFALIWLAIGVFCADTLIQTRASRGSATSRPPRRWRAGSPT